MRAEIELIHHSSILQFVEVIKLRLSQRAVMPDGVGQEAARVLALLNPLPVLTGTFPRSEHPSTLHLETAFASGGDTTATLLSAIRPVAFHLPWRCSYATRSDAPGLEKNIAFAEIIGP